MRTELVLDALKQAIWTRSRGAVEDLSGLVCHHDAGSQYTSIAFPERLPAAGAEPSVDVELATLEWVDWHTNWRLDTVCHDLTPVEYEQVFDVSTVAVGGSVRQRPRVGGSR